MDELFHKKLKQKYPDEQVYIVPYSNVIEWPDQFTLTNKRPDIHNGRFVFRFDAEYNPALIQLIPYILILNYQHDKIYVTKRIAGEERLKGTLALGCGGHINPEDYAINNPDYSGDFIRNAAIREMNEELYLEFYKNSQLFSVGTVQDHSSSTKEHFGIVYVTTAKNVSVNETDKMDGQWMSLAQLLASYESFESWARYIIDYLYIHRKGKKMFDGIL